MANSDINFYNYYFRYLWSATDFQNLENAHKDSYRGSFEAAYLGAVFTGLGIQRQSATIIRILPGIAISKQGAMMITTANTSVTITGKPTGSNAERALLVIRPLITDNTPITNPSNPTGPTINLRRKQGCEIALVRGVQGLTPAYPAAGADDVVLCGLYFTSGSWTLDDVDMNERATPGKNRNIPAAGYRVWDDRLRPFRASNVTIGIRPATPGFTYSVNTREAPLQFAWTKNGGRPSMFPRSSFGDPGTTDTIININTGVVSGGDQVSLNVGAPPTPTGTQYYLLGMIQIDADDKLTAVYDPNGQQFSKGNAINRIWATYDQMYGVLNRKTLCFFVLTSWNGTAWDDVDVYDARNEGNIAVAALQAQNKIEMMNDQAWVAPAGVTKVRLSLHQRRFRQAQIHGASCVAIDTAGAGYSWGKNGAGQLGIGNVTTQSSPILIVGAKTWKMITIGGGVSSQNSINMMGIDSNDDAYSWGYNGGGNPALGYQLGLGDLVDRSSPVIIPGGRKWRMLASSSNGTGYGITTDGDMYAWGQNGSGQVGDGTLIARSSPVLVLGGLKWRDVIAGTNLVFGITVDGNAYAWGSGSLYGALGTGTSFASSPVAVLGGLKFRNIATGYRNGPWAYGIQEGTGIAYYWGEGGWGIGNFGTSSPSLANSAGENQRRWRQFRGGYRTAFGLGEDGVTYAASTGNSTGAAGTGTNSDVYSYTPIVGPQKMVDFSLSQAGWESDFNESAMGLTADGQIMTWGYGGNGQFGNGAAPTGSTMRSSPVSISGPAGRFYNAIYDVFITQVDVDVNPGTTYQLKLYPGFVSFAGQGIAVSKLFLKATLEYLTS